MKICLNKKMPILNISLLLLLISCYCISSSAANTEKENGLQVIYAVNAGGHDHIDKHGIHYESDPLNIGTDSDYGNNLLMIGRVTKQDEVLYRTERYHTATFGYELPLQGDGEYVLVLKFCEVYFNEPNMKIFDVVLNRKHIVVSSLDIFAQVGRGTAHDEYAHFAIRRGKIYFKEEVSDIRNNMARLEFIKGSYDNPKINAFVLYKGDVNRIPKLNTLHTETVAQNNDVNENFDHFSSEKIVSPLDSKTKKSLNTKKYATEENNIHTHPVEEENLIIAEDEEDEIDPILTDNRRNSKTSGPRQPNPYTTDDSMVLMPVFIAIGCFIPLLFCLCKL